MKGVTLPVNILVIIVIAIIVLLGILALYFGGWSPFSSAIGVESVKNDACEYLVRRRCTLSTASVPTLEFDSDKDGTLGSSDAGNTWDWNNLPSSCIPSITLNSRDNLAALCYCFYGRTTEASCKQLCGCP